jgi:hypothetical protein
VDSQTAQKVKREILTAAKEIKEEIGKELKARF